MDKRSKNLSLIKVTSVFNLIVAEVCDRNDKYFSFICFKSMCGFNLPI